MTEQELIERGYRARQLLADEDVQTVFSDLERELFREWQIARTERERESLHATQRALERVVGKLQSWADELTRRHID